MKRLFKSAVALILILTIVLSLPTFTVDAADIITYSKTKNSGTRHVVCTSLSGTSASSYYTGGYSYDALDDLSASALLSSLRTLMTSTHKKQTSYSDCKSYSGQTDCQNEDGTVVLLYTSFVTSMSAFSGGSPGWNREHVWPKSLGGFETSGAGSDLHHIRPDNVKTNGTRGNKLFGNVNGGSQAYADTLVGTSVSGGTYSGNYFEPHDNVKGDVARICLYVYVRWGSQYTKCSSITNVFSDIDTLLEWCELDPVDTWEMGRNEVVQAIQGNRNVFIDYPELAWLLFDRDIPENMVTPSGNAMSGATPDTPPVCTHANTKTENAKAATCGADGYTGDTVCQSCGEKTKTGTVIAATGAHSYGAVTTVTPPTANEDGIGTRSCTVCGNTESVILPATGGSDSPGTEVPDPSDPTPDDPTPDDPTPDDPTPDVPTPDDPTPDVPTPDDPTPDDPTPDDPTPDDPTPDDPTPDDPIVTPPSATIEELIGGIEDNDTRILILIYLGIVDREFVDASAGAN